MQYQEARLRSFASATIKPKGRSKTKPAPLTWPLSPTTYPNLTPENLSQAGYYYAPLADDLDQCGCFLCDSKLGGWDEGDDPFEEHYRRGKCGWAMAVCSVMIDERRGGSSGKQTGKARLSYDDPDRLPQSETMIKARIKTFAKWWPHPMRGWTPTPSSLAHAGFVYTPTEQENDCVTCIYCDYSTVGWEPTDDPWDIHRKKKPNCSFFKAKLAGATGPVEVSEDELAITTTKRPASRTTKSAKSTKSAAGTTRRTTRKPAAPTIDPSDTDDPIANNDADETIRAPASPTKSRIRAGAKASKPATTGRGRKTAAVAAPTVDEEPPTDVGEGDYVLVPSVPPPEPEPNVKAPPTRRATRAAVVKKPTAVSTKSAPAAVTTKRSRKVAEPVPSSSEPVTEAEQEIAVPVVAVKSKGRAVSETTIRSKLAAGTTSATAASRVPKASGLPKLKTPAATARSKKAAVPPAAPPISETDQSQDRDDDREEASPTPMPMQVDKPDPERMKMIDTGAKEARSVIESLDQVTPGKSITASTSALSLDDEQAEMTVVEYIRAMYEAKHQAIKVEGEAKIRAWEEKARTAREMVQGMRCRDESE